MVFSSKTIFRYSKFHLFGIAIYGDPFFVAGKKAFHQLMSNSLRVFTINSLGDFVLFMGKAFVVVITVFSGIELLRPKENVIHHMWVPLTMAAIFAYLIAHCFITVYEVRPFMIFCYFTHNYTYIVIKIYSTDDNRYDIHMLL